MKQIDKKITGYKVVTNNEQEVSLENETSSNVVQMNEHVRRPEFLIGSTYKIKQPASDHAIYVTINDIVLNEGTAHEARRPYEIFINSKNMEHYQWVVALTLLVSAVFRKGGDITFIVDELGAVFDPQGGYFKRGGKFMPSLVAEIAEVIEKHLKMIGIIATEELEEHQKALIAEKKAQYLAKSQSGSETESNYPANATVCPKCNTKAVIKMDGCDTCLSCGHGKCS